MIVIRKARFLKKSDCIPNELDVRWERAIGLQMAKPTGENLPKLEGAMFTKYDQDDPWTNTRVFPPSLTPSLLFPHPASVLYEVIPLSWKAHLPIISPELVNHVEGSGEVGVSQAGLKQTHRIVSNWLLTVISLSHSFIHIKGLSPDHWLDLETLVMPHPNCEGEFAQSNVPFS